ncbi:MAG: hypothetical protein KDH96_02625 [Candidatus Riesia sp.]|nr:hypothetical protein [Candidatus Riesia sp.]
MSKGQSFEKGKLNHGGFVEEAIAELQNFDPTCKVKCSRHGVLYDLLTYEAEVNAFINPIVTLLGPDYRHANSYKLCRPLGNITVADLLAYLKSRPAGEWILGTRDNGDCGKITFLQHDSTTVVLSALVAEDTFECM